MSVGTLPDRRKHRASVPRFNGGSDIPTSPLITPAMVASAGVVVRSMAGDDADMVLRMLGIEGVA